jgi:hypothetical protein
VKVQGKAQRTGRAGPCTLGPLSCRTACSLLACSLPTASRPAGILKVPWGPSLCDSTGQSRPPGHAPGHPAMLPPTQPCSQPPRHAAASPPTPVQGTTHPGATPCPHGSNAHTGASLLRHPAPGCTGACGSDTQGLSIQGSLMSVPHYKGSAALLGECATVYHASSGRSAHS